MHRGRDRTPGPAGCNNESGCSYLSSPWVGGDSLAVHEKKMEISPDISRGVADLRRQLSAPRRRRFGSSSAHPARPVHPGFHGWLYVWGANGDCGKESLQQRDGRRGAAGNRDVDRDHVRTPPEARIALAEDAATAAAIADRG